MESPTAILSDRWTLRALTLAREVDTKRTLEGWPSADWVELGINAYDRYTLSLVSGPRDVANVCCWCWSRDTGDDVTGDDVIADDVTVADWLALRSRLLCPEAARQWWWSGSTVCRSRSSVPRSLRSRSRWWVEKVEWVMSSVTTLMTAALLLQQQQQQQQAVISITIRNVQ